MMLPGRATLNVVDLPPGIGANTAEGLDVLNSGWLQLLASFRF